MQKSTTAEIAEVSGDAPKGHRVDFATYRKRARPQLVKTLIATVERFTDSGECAADGYRRPRGTCHNYSEVERFPRADRVAPNVRSTYLPQVALETTRRICFGGTTFQACALILLVYAVPAFSERETFV